MKEKLSFAQDFLLAIEIMPFDNDIENYKQSLLSNVELNVLLRRRKQFFYIFDTTCFRNIFISETITKILGYQPADFYDFDFIYHCHHPEDYDFVMWFSRETMKFAARCQDILLKDPFCGVFSIDFRMKKRTGDYIWVNRKTSCFKTDNSGNMLYALSLYTDIHNFKHPKYITFSWNLPQGYNFEIDELVKKNYTHIPQKTPIEKLQLKFRKSNKE